MLDGAYVIETIVDSVREKLNLLNVICIYTQCGQFFHVLKPNEQTYIH